MPRLLPIKSHNNSIFYHVFDLLERRKHSFTCTHDDFVYKEYLSNETSIDLRIGQTILQQKLLF